MFVYIDDRDDEEFDDSYGYDYGCDEESYDYDYDSEKPAYDYAENEGGFY